MLLDLICKNWSDGNSLLFNAEQFGIFCNRKHFVSVSCSCKIVVTIFIVLSLLYTARLVTVSYKLACVGRSAGFDLVLTRRMISHSFYSFDSFSLSFRSVFLTDLLVLSPVLGLTFSSLGKWFCILSTVSIVFLFHLGQCFLQTCLCWAQCWVWHSLLQ